MFDRLLEIVLGNSVYLFSGVTLLVLILISLKSKEFFKGIKMVLCLAVLLWVGSVGYEYYTGYTVLSLFDKSRESSLGAEKEKGAFQKYMSTGSIEKLKDENR